MQFGAWPELKPDTSRVIGVSSSLVWSLPPDITNDDTRNNAVSQPPNPRASQKGYDNNAQVKRYKSLTRQCHSLSECYDASQIGYMNISIYMLLRPQVSFGIALARRVFSMAILVGYIRVRFFVEDGYEVQNCV